MRPSKRTINRILVTGGLGYLGAHTSIELLMDGYEVTILDNLVNSSKYVANSIEKISGRKPNVIIGDIQDSELLRSILPKIDAVIHFAALKSIPESLKYEGKYYENNVVGTFNLLKECKNHDIKKFVFSSSCTVYGSEINSEVKESDPTKLGNNPYAKSKLICESLVKESGLKYTILRYFNPIGYHESGMMMVMTDAHSTSLQDNLIRSRTDGRVFKIHKSPLGNSSCKRDFIHVMDLATAHLKSIQDVSSQTYNIGTGSPTSVHEIVGEWSRYFNLKVVESEARLGDVESVWSNTDKAVDLLEFKCNRNWRDAIHDLAVTLNNQEK